MFSDKFRVGIVIMLALIFVLPLSLFSHGKPKVIIETNMGEIELELDPDKAPVSVKNFLEYVKSEFYNGTIFHRVIDGFMIQCGGFDKDMKKKEVREPIKNEADNGLKK